MSTWARPPQHQPLTSSVTKQLRTPTDRERYIDKTSTSSNLTPGRGIPTTKSTMMNLSSANSQPSTSTLAPSAPTRSASCSTRLSQNSGECPQSPDYILARIINIHARRSRISKGRVKYLQGNFVISVNDIDETKF